MLPSSSSVDSFFIRLVFCFLFPSSPLLVHLDISS
jgi:hypothetical protein